MTSTLILHFERSSISQDGPPLTAPRDLGPVWLSYPFNPPTSHTHEPIIRMASAMVHPTSLAALSLVSRQPVKKKRNNIHNLIFCKPRVPLSFREDSERSRSSENCWLQNNTRRRLSLLLIRGAETVTSRCALHRNVCGYLSFSQKVQRRLLSVIVDVVLQPKRAVLGHHPPVLVSVGCVLSEPAKSRQPSPGSRRSGSSEVGGHVAGAHLLPVLVPGRSVAGEPFVMLPFHSLKRLHMPISLNMHDLTGSSMFRNARFSVVLTHKLRGVLYVP